MSKEYDHRKYAAYVLDLASRASCNEDKLRLLVMAEAWMDLADAPTALPGMTHQHLKSTPSWSLSLAEISPKRTRSR
jgi:hypothetical protein